MATSLRPFQSQTVARLVAGCRQVARRAGQGLHQGRAIAVRAALWGLQVALYPIYAAVQGARLGYRQLRATRPWQQAWARLSASHAPQPVAADIPIRSLLSVIQPPGMSSTLVRPIGRRLVHSYGRWLKQSQAGAGLISGQWHLLPLRATVRGIASDLTTRRLVLITTGNSVFSDLTDDQQHCLAQAIALMLAEAARGYRQALLTQQLQQPGLPLPQPQPALVLPLRWLPQALRWMQTSTLAAATNLFGEAAQPQGAQAIVWHRGNPSQKNRPSSREGGHPPEMGSPEIGPAEIGSPEIVSKSFSSDHGLAPPYRQPYGSIVWEPLPPTISVADAVAIATPRTVAAIESSPSDIVPYPGLSQYRVLGQAASTDLVVKERQEGSIHALLDGETSPTSEVQLSPSALEAKVTQVSYIDSPWVALLRGLDGLLYRLETWLHRLGAWLQHHW